LDEKVGEERSEDAGTAGGGVRDTNAKAETLKTEMGRVREQERRLPSDFVSRKCC
jgi:hypothetical protein